MELLLATTQTSPSLPSLDSTMKPPKFSNKEVKRSVLRAREKELQDLKDALGNLRADYQASLDQSNPTPVRSINQGGLPN